MILMYKILPLHLLLDVCSSYMRNYHMPHGGYLHHSGFPMQHANNYHYYDSHSSEKVVIHQSTRHSPRRNKYHRHIEYSDSEYKYNCECSCVKCQKRKPKSNSCCDEFCATECAVQNNILVVPYPVPFMIFNQSAQEIPPPTHMPSPTTSSSTTTTTERTTTTQATTTRKKDEVSFSTVPYFDTQPEVTFSTVPYFDTQSEVTFSTVPYFDTQSEVTFSTVPYYDTKPFKRFRIVDEKNLRRNNIPKNALRSPKFGRLPKYGIVPIPENLALSLMQQIRKDQSNGQLRKRLALNKNLLDYTRKPIA